MIFCYACCVLACSFLLASFLFLVHYVLVSILIFLVDFFNFSFHSDFQLDFELRIQDFKLGGAHLKKLRRAEGGAKIFGVFRVKNHDFTPKNHFFSNFRGGGRLDPPLLHEDFSFRRTIGTHQFNYIEIIHIQLSFWMERRCRILHLYGQRCKY